MDIPQERKVVTRDPRAEVEGVDGPARRGHDVGVPVDPSRSSPRSASGAIVEDVDGNRLIDFATGIAVLNVGHSAPDVVEAADPAAGTRHRTRAGVTGNEPTIELAERLNALTPGDFPKKTFFANSGAEAVENAVKVARYATGRQAIVCFDHAFHGRTLHGHDAHREGHAVQAGLRAVRARGLPAADGLPVPLARAVPEHCADEALAYALDEMHKHIGEQNIAGVLDRADPGRGRVHRPGARVPQGAGRLLRRARHRVHRRRDPERHGARGSLVRDRGRAGVVPDIVLTAKSLGRGLPISRRDRDAPT